MNLISFWDGNMLELRAKKSIHMLLFRPSNLMDSNELLSVRMDFTTLLIFSC